MNIKTWQITQAKQSIARILYTYGLFFLLKHTLLYILNKIKEHFFTKINCQYCKDTYELSNGLSCPQCCEHEFDINEGYTCINCDEQGDMGELIDAAEYQLEDR